MDDRYMKKYFTSLITIDMQNTMTNTVYLLYWLLFFKKIKDNVGKMGERAIHTTVADHIKQYLHFGKYESSSKH